jgi:MFS family permease
MFILGAGGEQPKYLLFLLAWLAGAAIAGYLSERKGYGDKPGLVTGLILSLAGALIWVFVPPRANSDWKIKGAFGNKRKDQPGS